MGFRNATKSEEELARLHYARLCYASLCISRETATPKVRCTENKKKDPEVTVEQ